MVMRDCSSALSSTLTLSIDHTSRTPKREISPCRRSSSSSRTLHQHDATFHHTDAEKFTAPQPPLKFLTPTPVYQVFHPPSACPSPLYNGSGTSSDPYIVDFLPHDQDNPYNWSSHFRWFITGIIALSALCIAFSSSSYSAAIKDVRHTFGNSQLEGIVGISLYVLGFGLGPLCWAPISEIKGRNFAFNISYPLFALFNLAAALSTNIHMLLVFRFLAGTFGSSPLTNAGGQIGDMWLPHERALAGSLFALAPFLGPVLGPIVGGFVAEYRGWRWVFWVNFIFAVVMLVLSVLFIPETYAPTILAKRARALNHQSSEDGSGLIYVSKYEVVTKSGWNVVKIGMMRPIAMSFREIIVLCLGIYVAIIYGTLYLFFTAYPIVFQQYRGWSISIGGLPFLGIGAGLLLGIAINPLGDKYYHRALQKAKKEGREVPPESRLPMCCVGAVLLPIGLFIFAWTSTPDVHWIVPILASVPFGCGYILIFTGVNMYLIDSYTLYAASALASNAVLRSILGTIFPLFSVQLYTKLGLHWAGTLLAFLSLACTPMPFLFYRYGPHLRRNSRYAPSTPAPVSEDGENVDGEVAMAATGVMATGEPDKAIHDQNERHDLEAGVRREEERSGTEEV